MCRIPFCNDALILSCVKNSCTPLSFTVGCPSWKARTHSQPGCSWFSSARAKMMEGEPLVNKKMKTNSVVRREEIIRGGGCTQWACVHTLIRSELMLREQRGSVIKHYGSPKTSYMQVRGEPEHMTVCGSLDKCVCVTCPEWTVCRWSPNTFNTEWVQDNSDMSRRQNWIKGHGKAHDILHHGPYPPKNIFFFVLIDFKYRKHSISACLHDKWSSYFSPEQVSNGCGHVSGPQHVNSTCAVCKSLKCVWFDTQQVYISTPVTVTE